MAFYLFHQLLPGTVFNDRKLIMKFWGLSLWWGQEDF